MCTAKNPFVKDQNIVNQIIIQSTASQLYFKWCKNERQKQEQMRVPTFNNTYGQYSKSFTVVVWLLVIAVKSIVPPEPSIMIVIFHY